MLKILATLGLLAGYLMLMIYTGILGYWILFAASAVVFLVLTEYAAIIVPNYLDNQ